MFNKNRKNVKKESLEFEEILSKDECKIKILNKGVVVGHAVYKDRKDGDIDLAWIGVEEEFQGQGFASKCLDYLCQKALNESKALVINVVDEEVLSNFYFKWFKRRANSSDIDDYDEDIIDYFETLVAKPGDKYFNINHPTLILKPEDINWAPNTKMDPVISI
ncbi:Uncharacterised protein [Legionella beliardensis]|uniref:N-acetyltransferase domain-containing protein n=1 Tax=Legionella beliardensis TaxID=91822 RepID=A0A378JP46_9GAMM|nr:GNAT family N-acetyltransferase [Legionella beliardensis]STX55553.1 Uncharacterised protein [Legionella beliardensis]